MKRPIYFYSKLDDYYELSNEATAVTSIRTVFALPRFRPLGPGK